MHSKQSENVYSFYDVFLFYPIFPLAFTLILSYRSNAWIETLLWVLLSGFSLAICLHVSVHEMVHRSGMKTLPTIRFIQYFSSLVIGLPFNGYRWHHLNHHKYVNQLEDFSTTWRLVNGEVKPASFVLYSLSWPHQLMRSIHQMRKERLEGAFPDGWVSRIVHEKIFLIICWALMLLLSPKLFLVYLSTIYFGWVRNEFIFS